MSCLPTYKGIRYKSTNDLFKSIKLSDLSDEQKIILGINKYDWNKQQPNTVEQNVEVVSRYSNADLKANPNKIYVFGDNTQRIGTVGQAQIRNNSNAFGIATKLKPTMNVDAFMTDNDLESNKQIIDSDIAKIKSQNKPLVFPKDGFGTGLAKLKEKAPKTYEYLKQRLLEEFGFNNDTGEIQPKSEVKPVSGELFDPNLPKINIYAGTGENAELSNFAIRPFVISGDEYQSVEQYFQYQKWNYLKEGIAEAQFKEDQKVADAIMNTSNGATLKSLGRKFKNLDAQSWDKNASKEMKVALKASFEQNPKALQQLLATGNAELTHIQDKGKWGEEFPKLLMEVRQELKPNVENNKEITKEDTDKLPPCIG